MAGIDALIGKLDELLKRWVEVGEQMSDPAVASDPVRIVAAAKEHARLGRVVDPYRVYKKAAADLDEAQAILDAPGSDADLKELAAGEIDALRAATESAFEAVKVVLVTGDDEDIRAVILELRAGTGGEEAALFVADLLNMYRRYAELRRWSFEVLSASPTDMGGFREVVVNVKGDAVWSHLGYEGGGHRVQRVPKTEAAGRIHTSAATVAVLPEPEQVDIDIDWGKDVEEFVSRAGGPGGQNVNKVESAVRLRHTETGVTVSMRDEKSQHKNRAKARRILAARVYEHHRSRQVAAEAATRKAMIGTGDRSQRVRTYNFPQNRCTDHRLKGGSQEGGNFNLEHILSGQLDEMIEALIARDRTQRLADLAV